MSVLTAVIGFLIVMGPLVFAHELGHFLLAKLGRIRVIEFGFGYPPRLWKFWQSQGRLSIEGAQVAIPHNFKAPLPKAEAIRLFKKPEQGDKSAGFGALDNLALPTDVMQALEPGRLVEALVKVDLQGERALSKIRLLDPEARDTARVTSDWQPAPGEQVIIGNVTDYVPGTEYTLNWLPVGGFTRMLGEEDPTALDSFAAAPKRWRAAVLLAGPVFNLVMAVIIFTAAFLTGWPEPKDLRVMIGSIRPGTPAETAGLQPGDLIAAINGQPMLEDKQVSQEVRSNQGSEITLTVERLPQKSNGPRQKIELRARPRAAGEYDPALEGPLGITMGTVPMGYDFRRYSIMEALPRGVNQTLGALGVVVMVPVQIIRGLIPASLARPVGPVGIGQIAGAGLEESMRLRGLYPLLSLAGLLSIALGITNLLPIPALDGGRLLFILVELIRRRRVDPKKETIVHLIGLALMLVLMAVITFQDIINPIVIPKQF